MWGATCRRYYICTDAGVSIHAPMWGATKGIIFGRNYSMFQFTHPCGVRLNVNKERIELNGFNSRTHVGCDPDTDTDAIASFKFQFTHPCGVRLSLHLELCSMSRVSIHAPMWGATWQCRANIERTQPFQFTHPCGVRLYKSILGKC